MKRIIVVILVWCIIITPVALGQTEEEILFRSIPWSTPAREYYDTLWNTVGKYADRPADDLDAKFKYRMFFDESSSESISYFDMEAIMFKYREELPAELKKFNLYIYPQEGYHVAGYPLSSISGTAIPRVTNGQVSDQDRAQVISIQYIYDKDTISNKTEWFNDMTDKLISLYGEYDSEYINTFSSEVTARLWLGRNNTYALLYLSLSPTLEYGLTNAKDLIEALKDPSSTVDKSSVEGL